MNLSMLRNNRIERRLHWELTFVRHTGSVTHPSQPPFHCLKAEMLRSIITGIIIWKQEVWNERSAEYRNCHRGCLRYFWSMTKYGKAFTERPSPIILVLVLRNWCHENNCKLIISESSSDFSFWKQLQIIEGRRGNDLRLAWLVYCIRFFWK